MMDDVRPPFVNLLSPTGTRDPTHYAEAGQKNDLGRTTLHHTMNRQPKPILRENQELS